MDTARTTTSPSAPQAFDLATTPLRNGSMLIEASAGTGKTYTLVGLILRLILEEHLPVTQILVVTFTKAATAELREKVREALAAVKHWLETGQDPGGQVPVFLQKLADAAPNERRQSVRHLEAALEEFNDAAIRTIHGFCQSVLQEQAFETGALFQADLMGDSTELLREILLDFWRRTFYGMERQYAALLLSSQQLYEGEASKAKPNPDYPLKLAQLEEVLKNWGRHPEARLPEGDEIFANTEEALQALQNGWNEFRTAAKSDLDDLKTLFLGDRKWGTGDYGKNKLEHNELRVRQLENCLESPGSTGMDDWEMLSHFRWPNICACTGKRYDPPPQLQTYVLAERLLKIRAKAVLTLKAEFIRFLTREMLVRGEQRQVFTFDSLLTEVDRAIQTDSGSLIRSLRDRYRVVLIDEFQDTDALQYRIFREIFHAPDRMMVMVGDPKQSIYRFRGADVNTYLKAAGEAQQRFTLSHNWRSDAPLIAACNRLFAQPQLPFAVPDIVYQPVASGLESIGKSCRLTLESEENPARLRIGLALEPEAMNKEKYIQWAVEWAVEEIARLMENGARIDNRPVTWGDFAILARTGVELRRMQQRLNALGIPSAMRTTSNIWGTAEAGHLEHVLRAIVETGDPSLLRGALATPLFGLTAAELAETVTDEDLWEDTLEEFRQYHDLWETHGFIQMFNRLCAKREVRRRFAERLDGLRSLTNFEHLAEQLHDQARREDLGKTRLLTFLQEKRRDPKNSDPEDNSEKLRIESDEPSLTLMTIHGSKGLEFPIVICPFLWTDHVPPGRKDNEGFYYDPEERSYFWNLQESLPEDLDEVLRRDRLSEGLRLLYVALTRARHQCSIFAGRLLSSSQKDTVIGHALPYVLHQNPQIAETCEGSLELLEKTLTGLVQAQPGDVQEQLETALGTRETGCPIAVIPSSPARRRRREIRPSLVEAAPGSLSEELAARKFTGKISRVWGISSFTSLNRSAKAARGKSAGPDWDDTPEDQLDTDATEQEPQPDLADGTPQIVPANTGIFALPAGARTGSMLHEILENLDFSADAAASQPLVESTLSGYGFPDNRFAPAIQKMLRDLVNLPLPVNPGDPGGSDDTFRLRDLQPARIRREMEFALPLEDLWLPRLKSAFAGDDSSPAWWPLFTDRLNQLAPRQMQGFLRGFIDLIFEHNGRFYIIDWKSNFLGNTKAAYQSGKLPRAIAADLYVLQYYIYTVATYRYLAQRLPDFSFDRHFGGIFYIFLRGLDSTYPGNGVFCDRPPEKRITQLDALLKNSGSG